MSANVKWRVSGGDWQKQHEFRYCEIACPGITLVPERSTDGDVTVARQAKVTEVKRTWQLPVK